MDLILKTDPENWPEEPTDISGMFLARVWDKGEEVYSGLFASREDAQFKLRDFFGVTMIEEMEPGTWTE